MPIKAIVRKLGVGRNTVRRALAADGTPSYSRRVKPSIVDAVEPQIRALLAQWPSMPTTMIAERVGWQRSMTVFKDRDYPFDECSGVESLTWRAELDQWLAQVAATVYAEVPFRRALIGFEVDEDRDITADKRYVAVVQPTPQGLDYRPANL